MDCILGNNVAILGSKARFSKVREKERERRRRRRERVKERVRGRHTGRSKGQICSGRHLQLGGRSPYNNVVVSARARMKLETCVSLLHAVLLRAARFSAANFGFVMVISRSHEIIPRQPANLPETATHFFFFLT